MGVVGHVLGLEPHNNSTNKAYHRMQGRRSPCLHTMYGVGRILRGPSLSIWLHRARRSRQEGPRGCNTVCKSGHALGLEHYNNGTNEAYLWNKGMLISAPTHHARCWANARDALMVDLVIG